MSRRGLHRSLLVLAVVTISTMTSAPSYAAGRATRPALDTVSSVSVSGWIVPLIALAIGGAGAIWRATTAQEIAKQSGLDPDLATQVSLLSDNGLPAEYLAANLRQPGAVEPTPLLAAGKGVAGRLEELHSLLVTGLITQDEYDARRRAIIDSI